MPPNPPRHPRGTPASDITPSPWPERSGRFNRPCSEIEASPRRPAGVLVQVWWMSLGGPRSGRIVMPISLWKATGWKPARTGRATIGSGGRTAGGAEQKVNAQVAAMAEGPGVSCCRRHPGQPLASVVGLFRAAASGCGICIGIGMAATACPRNPMPRAASRASARREASVPWLMEPHIAPGAGWFKLATRPCPLDGSAPRPRHAQIGHSRSRDRLWGGRQQDFNNGASRSLLEA